MSRSPMELCSRDCRVGSPRVESRSSNSPAVYLLRGEAARGRAAAGLETNQVRLMGLADDHDTPGFACVRGEDHWDCPVPNDELEVLVAASKHLFFPNIRREGKNDGVAGSGWA